MADPEEIYAEVLAEEQAKGSSAPVAEGRAKAARARAEAGSPHPKEPKWWPGAQPHLEGGDAGGGADEETEPAEAEEAEPEVEEAAQDTPAAAPVAEETPAATADEQAPQVPQEQTAPPPESVPAAATASVAPAATAAPAAAAEAPPTQKPSGVLHGTTTGTRLRPEDEATTDAQFQGQQDMYARRKLIDELVGTGVPAVAASETLEPKRSPGLALLYLLIPILAIAFVLAQNPSAPAEEGGHGEETTEQEGVLSLTAANVAFERNELVLPANEETTLHFVNEDSAPHNVAIYTDDSATEDLFVGRTIDGGSETDYEIPGLEPGEYFFRCDVHPTMTGTVTVE
ncbi:MAG TPA: cupredoxin domain-containing protein [Actinomycetota bacterium]|nr:cupredoxin domain-containing protein [Actinomycetota bacterium]